MKAMIKSITAVGIFATAMGLFEAAVVIYLRELYYKNGFDFPLKPMPAWMGLIEVAREAATIIMLICAGFLAGKTKLQRFAYFNLAFAIWDIWYYLFLYLFIGWPSSIFTWDILFLIPMPWVGPVWAPCLLCGLMILGSVFVIVQCHYNNSYRVAPLHWWSLISGAVVCIGAFVWDYVAYQVNTGSLLPSQQLFENFSHYIPKQFNSPLFFAGLLLMSFPVFYNMYLSFKLKSTINS